MNTNSLGNKNPNLISEKLYSLFLRCSHALSRGHHQSGGMHPSQQRILSLLASSDKITQHDLLDILQIRAASLSELLTKLESKRLINRTKAANNKRSIDVEITDLGEAVAAEYADSHQAVTTKLFSVLSEDEQQLLVQLLSRLIENWHNYHHGLNGNKDSLHGQKDGNDHTANHHDESTCP
ncbi:MarR family winged helix-turn-helix transcriptional regulator [Pectinatus cerevisiiphilus]|uniref:DNA-binding MarR family transcriptional regulator n=1 Tax=Pectinatus cerevisiiphilus TaxID=86956 RepID=A0A4R3K7A6_9FIRM|nr:MarR family winged helix-turn-helix transcriptional regulator [Pectinatus cerevisiiphilus]TCS78729.1 DNA-binding MarR family transcriptional regulator [Pectinatus cerevisiiphilus]